MSILSENYEFRICSTNIIAFNNDLFLYESGDAELEFELHRLVHAGKLSFLTVPEGVQILKQSNAKEFRKVNFCSPVPPVGSTGPCDCFINFTTISCTVVNVDAVCTIPSTNLPAHIVTTGACTNLNGTLTSGFINQNFTLCSDELEVTISGFPSVCPDDIVTDTWGPQIVCDNGDKHPDWDWLESGDVALSYQTSYGTTLFAAKEKAHAFSLKRIDGEWEYRDVDELSATIIANRLGEDDCEFKANESETDDCDNCKERVATVKGNQKTAHCPGDVFGSYHLKEGNTVITDWNHQIEFDCCI